MPGLIIACALALAAPQGSSARPRGARKARSKAVRKIDRAHVVGSPVLDDKARPGVYVWREDGLFRFAVVGAGKAITRFEVIGSRALTASEDEALIWVRKGPKHLIGRSRTGRGTVATDGHIKVGRARRDGRRARIYLGPLARRAASTVEIGAFGAFKGNRDSGASDPSGRRTPNSRARPAPPPSGRR